jgi:hypothetical protein
MVAAAAQSVPNAPAPSRAVLDATIGGKVRQLAVLTCNITRWGCDREMYAMAKVLADTNTTIARGKARPRDAKIRFSQSALDRAQLRARYRALRVGGGLFALPPQAANEPPPTRRFFLFRNR